MTGSEIHGWLVQEAGPEPGKRFAIEGEIVDVGRGTVCQIQLSDPKISRTHARFIILNQQLHIEDLNSTHGVLVNGRKIRKTVLAHGDQVQLGDTQFSVEMPTDSIATFMAAQVAGGQAEDVCRYCHASTGLDDSYCPGCGSIKRELPEPFEFVQQAYLQLRALFRSGKMEAGTFRSELEKMVISDGSGGYWMVGVQSGRWHWFDGVRWVPREPPSKSLQRVPFDSDR